MRPVIGYASQLVQPQGYALAWSSTRRSQVSLSDYERRQSSIVHSLELPCSGTHNRLAASAGYTT